MTQKHPPPEKPALPPSLAQHLALEPLIGELAATMAEGGKSTLSPEILTRQAQALDKLFAHFIEQNGVFDEPESIALALRIQRQCVRTVEIARRSFLPNELKDKRNDR